MQQSDTSTVTATIPEPERTAHRRESLSIP